MSGAMFGRWLGVAALVGGLALAPCAPVQARSKKPVLVYGPGMAGDEAESDARDAAADYLRSSRRSAPAYHVSEVPFFGPAPLWAVGDVEVRPCSAAARDTAEIRELVELGKEQTDLLEQEEADETFRSAWLALECADDFVARDLLYEVHFYSGLSAYVAGDTVKAEAAFVQAIATDPARRFDPGYPPEIEAIYDEAGRKRREGSTVTLHVADPDRAMTAIWLDGRSATGESQMTLSVGDHLLQFRTRFGTLTSMQLRVTVEGHAVLASREGMVEALLDPAADKAAKTVALAALAALAERHEAPAVVGVRRGDPPTLYRYDPPSTTLHLSASGGSGTPSGTAHPRRVALAVSGGWLFYPVQGIAAADASYGTVGLQAEVPMIGPLALDLGLGLAMRGAGEWDDARWTYLLPSVRSGLHVNLATGVVRPYVGGAFHLTVQRDSDVWGGTGRARAAAGGVGVVGLAIEVSDHLRFHADLHAGHGAAPILQVSIGAGLRF